MEKLNNFLGSITKYLTVLRISWEENFVYRTNFILWRVRTVMQFLILYFFWSVVFSGTDELFGYTRASILTYVLGTSLIRSMVLSSRSVDVAGEIHQGILTNFLVKPVSYLSYWFTRDIADKVLNIIFTIFELGILIWLLKPPLILQTDPAILMAFILVTILGLLLYFYLSFLLSITGFWVREVWAPRFLALVFIEFLSGGVFPLDILPAGVFNFLRLLPFTYLIFFPLKVYLGQLTLPEILAGASILVGWIALSVVAVQYVWAKGLKVYEAEGR